MNRFSFISTLIVSLCISACEKADFGDCVKSTGPITSETLELSAFDIIELYDNIDVVLIQDTFYSAEIIAGKNLIDKIKIRQTANVISLKNENSCNWVRSFKKSITVRITAPDLVMLNYFGSGNISSAGTLHYKELNVHAWEASGSIDIDLICPLSVFALHTGPVDLKLRGTAGVVTLYAAGFGTADVRTLDVDYFFVNNQGTGHFYVTSNVLLEVRIGGTGNIYCSSKPTLVNVLENTGSGELIFID